MWDDRKIIFDGLEFLPEDFLEYISSPDLPIDEFNRRAVEALVVMGDNKEFVVMLNEKKKKRFGRGFMNFEVTTSQNEPCRISVNKRISKGRASTDVEQKPEKQHGVEYPVFSKGSGVTEAHVKALYGLLTARGWISSQTELVDFQRLFNGVSNDCEIIWMGQDKLGANKTTNLGLSALYVLFKSMADEKLITTGSSVERVGPILESHFVDKKGHFLTSVSNVSTTSQKAKDYIKLILKTMRMRPASEDIQRLLEEDMESKYDENDRQDLNYRRPH